MKKTIKKFLASVLAVVTLVSAVAVMPQDTNAASFSTVDGWYETIYAEISGVKDADVTGVSWTGTTSGSLTGDALTYLVRDTSNGVRIDVPGVKPGTYTLNVTTTSGTVTKSGITVVAYDRSGYAHFNYTSGVGAYKDDGTLKDNAIVLYVTDANKDTVSVTSKDGTKVTGIGHILNSSGKDTGSGQTSKGGTPNNNSNIISKLAADGTPLVVRIIGNVTAPDGLTEYNSVNYGGSVGDNGYMARMQSGLNVTIEGIGSDAVINGWGIHFMCLDSEPEYGKSFEVRNIAFKNVPEDCIGMEGVQSGSTLTASVERCWIHHCEFYAPKISNPAESDKDGGDGACDFKRGQYFTNSYCYYQGYHKTNLVGASDSNVQYHITYHHNYWKNCESRGPLLRQANVHMYNNVFEGQTSYCMNPRANGYIFSEYNVFKNSKNPMQIKSGAIKSFNDTFESCSGDKDGTIVSSKSTKVSSSNKYASFELDSSVSYVPSNNYVLQTSNVYDTTTAVAGVLSVGSATVAPTQGSTSSQETTASGGQATTQAPQETTGSSGGGSTVVEQEYVHNFTTDGKDSSFYTITGNLAEKGDVTYNGLKLTQCLKIESSTSITFTAPKAGTLTLVFGGSTSAAGKGIKIDGTSQDINSDQILTIDLAAGSHTISKDDSIFLYYMVFAVEGEAHSHSYTATVTKAATCTEAGVKTYTCSCGHSYTEAIAATGHNYSSEWTIDVEATTTTEGSKSRHCTVCDAKTDVTVIPKVEVEEVKNGLILENGKYYYYVNGSVATGFTGLVQNEGIWWYINAGVLDTSYTGTVVNGGVTWYVINGKLDSEYTGIRKNGTDFWYVVNGKVNTDFVGLYQYANYWWYITDGKIQTGYTGIVDYSGYKWFVSGGKVDTSYTGLRADSTGTFYCIQAGKINLTYTGLVQSGGSWWYVVNGVLNTSTTGIVTASGSQWFVATGKLQSAYTGNYTYQGVTYVIVNGKVTGTK